MLVLVLEFSRINARRRPMGPNIGPHMRHRDRLVADATSIEEVTPPKRKTRSPVTVVTPHSRIKWSDKSDRLGRHSHRAE